MATVTLSRPPLAALWHKARAVMDVIFHIGAHRTATTSFQAYMRANEGRLQKHGVAYWGPGKTRNGVLAGVLPVPGLLSAERQFRLARGRVLTQCETAQRAGVRHLLVSDENMIGTPRRNVRTASLYADIGERIARYGEAFGGRVDRVTLTIRSLDGYWASMLAYVVARGRCLPAVDDLDRLVTQRRSWRDVVVDLSNALPIGTELQVTTHEEFAGRPEARLEQMTNGAIIAPKTHARDWLNRGPDLATLRLILQDRDEASTLPNGSGRWHPFDAAQTAALRETYADDLFWLAAGAQGLAKFITKTGSKEAGKHPSDRQMTRGYNHDIEEGRLARSG